MPLRQGKLQSLVANTFIAANPALLSYFGWCTVHAKVVPSGQALHTVASSVPGSHLALVSSECYVSDHQAECLVVRFADLKAHNNKC